MPMMTRRAICIAGRSTLGWPVWMAAACGIQRDRFDDSLSGMPKPGEVVRITYLNSSADTAPVFQRIVDEFNKRNPGIVAELTVAQGAPFFEKLQAMIAGGTPPDGAHLNYVQLPILAGAGMLRDIGDYVRVSIRPTSTACGPTN